MTRWIVEITSDHYTQDSESFVVYKKFAFAHEYQDNGNGSEYDAAMDHAYAIVEEKFDTPGQRWYVDNMRKDDE